MQLVGRADVHRVDVVAVEQGVELGRREREVVGRGVGGCTLAGRAEQADHVVAATAQRGHDPRRCDVAGADQAEAQAGHAVRSSGRRAPGAATAGRALPPGASTGRSAQGVPSTGRAPQPGAITGRWAYGTATAGRAPQTGAIAGRGAYGTATTEVEVIRRMVSSSRPI